MRCTELNLGFDKDNHKLRIAMILLGLIELGKRLGKKPENMESLVKKALKITELEEIYKILNELKERLGEDKINELINNYILGDIKLKELNIDIPPDELLENTLIKGLQTIKTMLNSKSDAKISSLLLIKILSQINFNSGSESKLGIDEFLVPFVAMISSVYEDQNMSFALVMIELENKFDLIFAARRPSDMYAASFILSIITQSIIEKLAEKWGYECVIKPYPLLNPYIQAKLADKINLDISKEVKPISIPASLIAIVPYSAANSITQEIISILKKSWLEIYNYVIKYIRESIDLSQLNHTEKLHSNPPINIAVTVLKVKHDRKYLKDICRFLDEAKEMKYEECSSIIESKNAKSYWYIVMKALNNLHLGMTYSKVRKAPELAFNELSEIHTFINVNGKKKLVKACTNCWSRKPIVFYEKANDELKLMLRLREHERLCIVDIIKRLVGLYLARRNIEFLKEILNKLEINIPEKALPHLMPIIYTDTLSIASLSYKITLLEAYIEGVKELKELVSLEGIEKYKVKNLKFIIKPKHPQIEDEVIDTIIQLEGDIFYPEMKIEYLDREKLRKIINKLEENIKKACKSIQVSIPIYVKPADNFAIIYIDGDDIGRFLLGDNPYEVYDRITGKRIYPGALHVCRASKYLSLTAKKLIDVLCRESLHFHVHIAMPVFAGGDDFILFAAPDQAYFIIEALVEALKEPLYSRYHLLNPLTYSIVLGFFNIAYPLRNALQDVQYGISEAKTYVSGSYKKGCLAIIRATRTKKQGPYFLPIFMDKNIIKLLLMALGVFTGKYVAIPLSLVKNKIIQTTTPTFSLQHIRRLLILIEEKGIHEDVALIYIASKLKFSSRFKLMEHYLDNIVNEMIKVMNLRYTTRHSSGTILSNFIKSILTSSEAIGSNLLRWGVYV